TSQGGIQALSRSMYGKLIPDKDRSGEFFGFFDIFGKFSSIMGPALVGVVSSVVANGMLGAQGLNAQTATAEQIDAINAQSSHYGILSIIIIIIVGRGAVLRLFAQSRARQAVNLTRYSIRITI
ncbi:MDR-type permease, partial [human gut metagenome]